VGFGSRRGLGAAPGGDPGVAATVTGQPCGLG